MPLYPDPSEEYDSDYGYDQEEAVKRIFGEEEKVVINGASEVETTSSNIDSPVLGVPVIHPMALMPVMSIPNAKIRRDTVYHFINNVLIEGKDYGVIPGTEKKNLLLPGSEQFRIFFGLTTEIIKTNVIEDPFGAKLGTGIPYFSAEIHLAIKKDGSLICVGIGQANSQESKWGYRWRAVQPGEKIPEGAVVKDGSMVEFEFAIEKAETTGQYGKPAEYWNAFKEAIKEGNARRINKKTRTGKEMAAWEIGGKMIRVPNEEVYSQANTILKIALKRAKVDGIKDALGISDIFTQDMEENELGEAFVPGIPVISGVDLAKGQDRSVTVTLPPQQASAAPPQGSGATQTARPDVTMPRPVQGFQRAPAAAGAVSVPPTKPPVKAEKPSEIPDIFETTANSAKVTPRKDPAPSVDLEAEENKRIIIMEDVKALIDFAKSHGVSQKALANFVMESFNKKILSGTPQDKDRKVLMTRGELLKTKVFVTNGLMSQDQQMQLARRGKLCGVEPEKLAEYVSVNFGMAVKHLSMTQMLKIDEWLEENASKK